MESKAFLFTSIPIIGIIIVFGYLNIQQEKALPTISDTSELCKVIEYNGEDRIDLLFLSSVEDAEYYTDYLFTVEPYKTYRKSFNVRVLEQEPTCTYYQGIAILCNNKETQAKAKECTHDYIIALKEDEPKIRSSAYGNVLSINMVDSNPLAVLIHEFGHLYNLAEEYGGGAKIPKGSQNCQTSCDKFKFPIDSCNLECSDSSHFRSIENGVMRTLATSNYGIHNMALLKEMLEKSKPSEQTLTANAISEDEKCNSKILEVEVRGSTVTTDNNLVEGCVPKSSFAGQICIGDNNNRCNIDTLFTDAPLDNLDLTGETYLNPDVPLIFYVQQDPTNPRVEITRDGEVIRTINTMEAGATACHL